VKEAVKGIADAIGQVKIHSLEISLDCRALPGNQGYSRTCHYMSLTHHIEGGYERNTIREDWKTHTIEGIYSVLGPFMMLQGIPQVNVFNVLAE